MQKRDFPPDVIDAAVIGTLKMLLRGKEITWNGVRMYQLGLFCIIGDEPVGDPVDGVIIWFIRYSKADPRMGHWCENDNTIAFLKRRWL